MLPQQPTPPLFEFIKCHCKQTQEFIDLITHFIASQITPCAPAPSLRMFPSHVYLSTCRRIKHWQPYLGEQNENWPTNPLPTQLWHFRICFQSLAQFSWGKHVRQPKGVARQTHILLLSERILCPECSPGQTVRLCSHSNKYAQRELLGNTSLIYTFSETALNTAQAGFPTACLSKSLSWGHENCPNAHSAGQTDSKPDQEREVLCCKLIHDDYFDAIITWMSE